MNIKCPLGLHNWHYSTIKSKNQSLTGEQRVCLVGRKSERERVITVAVNYEKALGKVIVRYLSTSRSLFVEQKDVTR